MRVVLFVTFLLGGTVNCGLVAAPLATIVRAPKYDSAIIQSDRLGGNFAYSTAESHAYAVVSPIVEHVMKPVAVTYTAQQIVSPVVVAPVLPPVISTSVIHTAALVAPVAPVVAPAIAPVDPAIVSVPQIISNVVEPVEVSADSPPEAAGTPTAEESDSDASAESKDDVIVESD